MPDAEGPGAVPGAGDVADVALGGRVVEGGVEREEGGSDDIHPWGRGDAPQEGTHGRYQHAHGD